jgi:hypothetical protein
MRTTSTHLGRALALALLAACSASSFDTGSVQLTVAMPQALSASITRVSVTASGADFPSVSVNLGASNGTWGGLLRNLPAGADRTFHAQAFDASDTLRFEGSASGVSIAANQTAPVVITLEQLHAPEPFSNEAPLIDSLVAASTIVSAGGALALEAAAHDPNPDDLLTYAWTSTDGAFSSDGEASTTWTAPSSPGLQTLTFTATDSQGLASSLSVNIYVSAHGEQLGPVIVPSSRSSDSAAPGQVLTFEVTASDP